MFKSFLILMILVSTLYITYELGHTAGLNKAKAYYVNMIVESKNNYIDQLKKQREQYERKKQELETKIKESQTTLSKLRSDADNIRLQLAKQFPTGRSSVSSSNDRSQSTNGCDCGRLRKMETVLKRATDLIQERDEIAEQYNQLRAQCRLN